MFGFAAIFAAIASVNIPSDRLDIELPELDPNRRIGVGRDGETSFVFVGPGQPSGKELRGAQFRFEPWVELVDRRSGVVLRDVCVLRFRPEDNSKVQDAVSAVFAGLVELALSTPAVLGTAIETMEGLFESGLTSRVSRETEIGLAGELLVIAEAADPGVLANMWHSKADAKFDFSAQGERLEVKTTTGVERVHWFSSGQVAPIPGVCSTFVSIVLPVVEVGSTVASVFAELSALTPEEKARARAVIIETAKEPPEVLNTIVFDRGAARASMLHIGPQHVPAPSAPHGVGRMYWEAALRPDASGPPSTCGLAASLGF